LDDATNTSDDVTNTSDDATKTRDDAMRRLILSIVLVGAGVVGGLVISGWVRAAETSHGSEPSRAVARVASDQGPSAVSPTPAQPAYAGTSGPDFTRVAGHYAKAVNSQQTMITARK
jgi:hypothetical protein